MKIPAASEVAALSETRVTTHSAADCVSPASGSLNALEESVGVRDWPVALLAGELLPGVLGGRSAPLTTLKLEPPMSTTDYPIAFPAR